MNTRVNRGSPIFREVEGLLGRLLVSRTLSGKHTIASTELLPIFEKYPSLASNTEFSVRFDRLSTATPLACFLMAGITDAQVIEALCQKMKPEELEASLNERGRHNRLPLHEACLLSSDAVVNFLLSHKAITFSGLSIQDRLENFPFDLALKNPKLSLTTKRKLLELNPEAVGVGNSFRTAVVQSDLDMLQFIANIWPAKRTRFCLDKSDQDPIWALEVGHIFAQLLPKLSSLSSSYIRWDIPTFRFFLDELSSNKSIQKIEGLAIPVTEQPDDTESLLEGFQQALQNNNTLKDISNIGFPKRRGASRDRIPVPLAIHWVRVMDRVTRTSRSLRFLSFTARIRGGGSLECESQPRAPSSTTDGRHSLPLRLFCVGRSFVESTDFLQMLPTLLSLTDVSLDFSLLEDVAMQRDRIVALLRSNHHFQSVALTVGGGGDFDVVPVCDALKVNHRLVSFHLYGPRSATSQMTRAFRSMLKKCNTMLTSCVFPGGDDDTRVQHYLQLNRFGRSHIRGPATNQRRSKLVQLLLAARVDSELKLSGKTRVQSIIYGLLLENPTLWSQDARTGTGGVASGTLVVADESTRKRKDPPL